MQPNHIETVVAEVDVDGEPHLVKFSRYHDNQQFWTVPGERDERLHGRKTITVTEPEPDEYELYDLTLDPFEERNLAHPSHADDPRPPLEQNMLGLLHEQLAAKRLVTVAGEVPWVSATGPRLISIPSDLRSRSHAPIASQSRQLTHVRVWSMGAPSPGPAEPLRLCHG